MRKNRWWETVQHQATVVSESASEVCSSSHQQSHEPHPSSFNTHLVLLCFCVKCYELYKMFQTEPKYRTLRLSVPRSSVVHWLYKHCSLYTVHTVRQLQHSHDTTVSYSQTAFQARVCRQLLIWSRAVSSVPGSQYCCYVTWDSPSQSLVVHQPYNKEDNIREKFNNHHHTNNAWEEEGIQLSR